MPDTPFTSTHRHTYSNIHTHTHIHTHTYTHTYHTHTIYESMIKTSLKPAYTVLTTHTYTVVFK